MITTIATLTIIFVIGFMCLELVQKTTHMKIEYSRKIAHVAAGLSALCISPFISQQVFLITTTLFIGFFTVSKTFNLLPSIHNIKRVSYGEILFPFGLVLIASTFYYPHPLFSCGLLLLALPDSMAGIIGSLVDSTKKTTTGSFVYLIVSILVLVFFFPLPVATLFALFLTIVERISPYGSDNATIPLAFIVLSSSIT